MPNRRVSTTPAGLYDENDTTETNTYTLKSFNGGPRDVSAIVQFSTNKTTALVFVTTDPGEIATTLSPTGCPCVAQVWFSVGTPKNRIRPVDSQSITL